MGARGHFLARGEVPLLRRQAVAKCFGFDTASSHTVEWSSTPACPTSAAPNWHGMQKTPLHIRAKWLLLPPQVPVASLLETSGFTAMRHFEYRDGGLGLPRPEKCGAVTNRPPSVRKGRIVGTWFRLVLVFISPSAALVPKKSWGVLDKLNLTDYGKPRSCNIVGFGRHDGTLPMK